MSEPKNSRTLSGVVAYGRPRSLITCHACGCAVGGAATISVLLTSDCAPAFALSSSARDAGNTLPGIKERDYATQTTAGPVTDTNGGRAVLDTAVQCWLHKSGSERKSTWQVVSDLAMDHSGVQGLSMMRLPHTGTWWGAGVGGSDFSWAITHST